VCVHSVLSVLFLLFFFFQAEDGIRDFHVTGVQTCALPICIVFFEPDISEVPTSVNASAKRCGHFARCGCDGSRAAKRSQDAARRSEERRVGKECRTRWSPQQETKRTQFRQVRRVRKYK